MYKHLHRGLLRFKKIFYFFALGEKKTGGVMKPWEECGNTEACLMRIRE